MSLAHPPGLLFPSMSRPQVGIERLPTRRMSNEPRESMNCKSCRKRKIKCNRLRPSCEACQIFQCPCVYDAVPKKRGPKTDVLEALLKRVDGLEAQLKDRKRTSSGTSIAEESSQSFKTESAEDNNTERSGSDSTPAVSTTETSEPPPKRMAVDTSRRRDSESDTVLCSPATTNAPPPSPPPPPPPPPLPPTTNTTTTTTTTTSTTIQSHVLVDMYFTRLHAKPYHILDESFIRQRLRLNQLPPFLVHAIYAVAARYMAHPHGYRAAVQLGEDFASMSRKELDIDEPAVDTLQALLLLVLAYMAAGKGKKAYMLLANAIGMAMALELHREADANAPISALDREMRRRLFWSCYLLDRFLACGSKRPCLVGDKTIFLRLPFWFPTPGGLPIEGEFFQASPSLPSLQGGGRKFQGGSAMLIDIGRILGVTNRYLATGGVKSDSHFPWHTLSSLSKIRQDLDIWASGTDDVFSSLEALFGHPECTVLVLSKLIYHLIYCLIYRPFLPVSLAELSVTGQHQSWQIEATNMCFLHANAITELVELGKQTGATEWPAFVGYCICTAGTVHIHGAHYSRAGLRGGDAGAFAASADFLAREMHQLGELRYVWASVQQQRDTLQNVCHAHGELVKRLAASSMHCSPAFNLEDFFSRYANVVGPGGEPFAFDASSLSLSLSLTDVSVDVAADVYSAQDLLYSPREDNGETERPNLKRKHAASFSHHRPELGHASSSSSSSSNGSIPRNRTTSVASSARRFSMPAGATGLAMLLRVSPSTPTNAERQDLRRTREEAMNSSVKTTIAPAYTETETETETETDTQQTQTFPDDSSSPRNLFLLHQNADNHNHNHSSNNNNNNHNHNHNNTGSSNGFGNYDPMFGGMLTNTFPSPAPVSVSVSASVSASAPWPDNEDVDTALPIGTKTAVHESSPGTAAVDEKDPFLSLLEQLAENENVVGQGTELDFLLGAVRG